jgi:hypothetical protein
MSNIVISKLGACYVLMWSLVIRRFKYNELLTIMTIVTWYKFFIHVFIKATTAQCIFVQ